MLAERPSTVENSGAEIDLFAGLSFPEVPSAPVEVSSRQSIVGLPNPPAYNPQHIPLASILVDTAVNSELEQNIRKSGNLSALYSPEVALVNASSLYPALPSLGVAVSGDAVEEEEATFDGSSLSAYQHDETDSLLPRSSRSVPPRVHTGSVLLDQPPAVSQQPYLHNPVQDQRQQHPSQHAVSSSSGAPELITDLVMENSRLADEVANLRKMLSDQEHQAGSATSAGHHAGAYDTVNQQRSVAQSSSVTGVHIEDATRPPEKGVKYVCCGGCRQWLMAPRDAQFVVCGTCESINNCNLAPKENTAAHNRENEQRALAQRNANQAAGSFWFLDCLSRGFT